MTENDARDWVRARITPAAFDRMTAFVAAVVAENQRQNLISPTTIATIWHRHVVDSLQLLEWGGAGVWLDIGTGGGFPGMVLAIAGAPVHMVEPRRKRATFLMDQVGALTLANARVSCARVEQITDTVDIITARAVASVEKLLLAAAHCATSRTRWLLPRGTIDPIELRDTAARHKLVFHVEQSLTHPDSAILILTGRDR